MKLKNCDSCKSGVGIGVFSRKQHVLVNFSVSYFGGLGMAIDSIDLTQQRLRVRALEALPLTGGGPGCELSP